jgi:hypothetical protein
VSAILILSSIVVPVRGPHQFGTGVGPVGDAWEEKEASVDGLRPVGPIP